MTGLNEAKSLANNEYNSGGVMLNSRSNSGKTTTQEERYRQDSNLLQTYSSVSMNDSNWHRAARSDNFPWPVTVILFPTSSWISGLRRKLRISCVNNRKFALQGQRISAHASYGIIHVKHCSSLLFLAINVVNKQLKS